MGRFRLGLEVYRNHSSGDQTQQSLPQKLTLRLTCQGAAMMESIWKRNERNFSRPALGGRTIRSSSYLFLSLLALITPFSQSEIIRDSSPRGSFSSAVENSFRFFRLSDHVAYKNSAPINTNTVGLSGWKTNARILDEPERVPITDPIIIPFFFEQLTSCFLQTHANSS